MFLNVAGRHSICYHCYIHHKSSIREVARSTHSSVLLMTFLLALICASACAFAGKYPSNSIHSPTKAVIIRVQSSTVGRSKCSPSSSIVCQTLGNGVGIICNTSTPRAINGMWSSCTPHAELNLFESFLLSGRKGWSGFDCKRPRDRRRPSIVARFWYAQWVVLKYEGTLGFSTPRRSRSTKREMELKAFL